MLEIIINKYKIGFKKVFNLVARYTSYILILTFSSGGMAGVIASLFCLYYFEAVQVPISDFMMDLLKFLLVILWVFAAFQHGFFFRLGIKGIFGKTIHIINKYVESNPIVKIKDNLKPHEYQELLKALFYVPKFIANTMAGIVLAAVIIIVTIGFYANELNNLISHIIYLSAICLFVAYNFTLLLCELNSGEIRAECMRIMNEKGIPSIEKHHVSTVGSKLFFFIVLLVIDLFLSNLITYSNRDKLYNVWSFSFFAILVSLIIVVIIFYGTYSSLKQIEKAAYDLMNGGRGVLFLKSIDKEFLNVAAGVNNASITIDDYQTDLEKKVEQRTIELKEAVLKLNETVKALNEKERLLETELEFAANIQQGIIPTGSDMEPWNGINFASYYAPMGKVSGDYYDIFRFPNCVFALLADASGHGVPAALVTMAAKQAFSTYIDKDLKPSEVFKKVNTVLEEKIKTSDYLTAFIVKIDEKNRVVYANASHPKAIHFNRKLNESILLDTNGMFIGAIKEAGDFYEDKYLKLQSGDRLYLYTDGLVEHKNIHGEEYGIDRLLETISVTRNLNLNDQVGKIVDSFYKFLGTAPIKDDISILALELQSQWSKFIELYNAGIKLLRNNSIGEALEQFLAAKNLIPNFSGLLYQLSLVNYQLGKYQEAEKLIQSYLEKKGEDPKAIQLAINIYLKLDKKEKAKELMKNLKTEEHS